MGSPLGPLMANIFTGFHELPSLIVISTTSMICLHHFLHVVKWKEFFSYLNNLHSSLQYTMEVEENNKLPSLDLLVERTPSGFLTSVYQKPTFSGL